MPQRAVSRRRLLEQGLLASSLAVSTLGIPFTRQAFANEPELTEDGLHFQPWFLESFLELPEDLTGAADAGKYFAVMWEVKGCPYCKKTHHVNFAQENIRNYITTKFDVLQLNTIGSRIVTDFDGEEISEKKLAAKYEVRFTPTIQFFPKSLTGLDGKKPKNREIIRLPGYLEPVKFLSMFRYVAEEAYKDQGIKEYLENV